jgi:molybdopterin biosynthesis enzyme
LVAEPGKGGYWITQGDRVGHLIVESIKDGRIVWRDGARLQETAVAIKDTPPLAQVKSRMPVAVRSGGSEVRPVSASLSDGRGMGAPGVQPVADEGLD